MKDQLLKLIRSINFTAIFSSFLVGISGPIGWVLRLVAGPILKGIEDSVDKQIDQTVAVDDADKAAELKAEKDKQQIKDAKTDEEVNEALRNSQR